MTEMVVVQQKANLTSYASLFLRRIKSTTSSTVAIEGTEMKAHSLKNAYRYNPFTNSIVEIDPTQAWFWAPKWLEGEIIVEEEKISGHFEDFFDLDGLFSDL